MRPWYSALVPRRRRITETGQDAAYCHGCSRDLVIDGAVTRESIIAPKSMHRGAWLVSVLCRSACSWLGTGRQLDKARDERQRPVNGPSD